MLLRLALPQKAEGAKFKINILSQDNDIVAQTLGRLIKSASPVSTAALLTFRRTAILLNSSASRLLLRVKLFLFFISNIST